MLSEVLGELREKQKENWKRKEIFDQLNLKCRHLRDNFKMEKAKSTFNLNSTFQQLIEDDAHAVRPQHHQARSLHYSSEILWRAKGKENFWGRDSENGSRTTKPALGRSSRGIAILSRALQTHSERRREVTLNTPIFHFFISKSTTTGRASENK